MQMGSIKQWRGHWEPTGNQFQGIEEMVEGEAAWVADLGKRKASDIALRQFGLGRKGCRSHRA